MPINGFDVGTWDATIPAAAESVGLGDDRIRSVKTTLQQALDSEHIWPSGGGIVGQHRAGSARAFYGLQSQVSASTTSVVNDGRMMIASDTSRLFGVGSGGTVLLGGFGVVSLDTLITFPQRSRWAMEVGIVESNGTPTVTFPNSGFSGAPFLYVSVYSQPPAGVVGLISAVWKLHSVSKSAFSGLLVDSTNNIMRSDVGITWMSIGTRAL